MISTFLFPIIFFGKIVVKVVHPSDVTHSVFNYAEWSSEFHNTPPIRNLYENDVQELFLKVGLLKDHPQTQLT